MAHPFAQHRQSNVERDRVSHITNGYADGGQVKLPPPVPLPTKSSKNTGDDMKADTSSNQPDFLKGKKALKCGGAASKPRLDRYARGGKVKSRGETNVNIIVSPQGAERPAPMSAGPDMPPPPGMSAPRPPMMPPPGAMPPPMPPGMPHRNGGRAYAKGGAVKDGPAWKEGRRNGTAVQHTDGKNDGSDIYRGRQITYKTGGAVEASNKRGPKLPGGDNGKGRLAKAALQRRSKLP